MAAKRAAANGAPDLRTKVSHDLSAEIGRDLFHRIVGDQLETTVRHFWDVVRDRIRPGEEELRPRPTSRPIPGWLVARLVHTVGLPEEEVRAVTAQEAMAAWERFRAHPR